MVLFVWMKPITINEMIVLLHEIGSFAGDGSQIELKGNHLRIALDIPLYTDDPTEQESILEELMMTVMEYSCVEKVERA